MNLLFLRGKLPLDFRPDRLEYGKIDECEDMWTVLCERVSRSFDNTELWYYKAKHEKKKCVTDKFVERWVNFSNMPNFVPDVIIARGGFKDYKVVCDRFPKAKKVYYGAGVRFRPEWGKWDLVLVDSLKQKSKVPGSKLFIKPAADNLFYPVSKVKKEFDVCFMANATQAEIKRHKLAFRSLAGTDISVLHLGLCDKKIKKFAANTNVTFGGWHRRSKLPKKICKCKIGLVCSTSYDSCPRVLPEYLSCGLPVVAVDEMNFWHEKYVNNDTGILCGAGGIKESVLKLLKMNVSPHLYYRNNLSLDVAAARLLMQLA